MTQQNRGINDLAVFILTFAYTVAVLLAKTWSGCVFWLILSMVQLQLTSRIRWKYVIIFSLLLIIPGISLFITSYLHLKETVTGSSRQIFGFVFDNYRLQTSLYLMIRANVLSIISFSFLTAIRYDRLIYSLIQNLGFPVSWGYALLAAFNAVGKLREEFLRIRQAINMRFSRKPLFYFYIIPLLVSATRYSQQAAISLQTRGLNQKKSFIIRAEMEIIDYVYLAVNIAGIILAGRYF